MEEKISIIYKGGCPNCGNNISSERLILGLPCDNCLKEEIQKEIICEYINEGKLKDFCELKRNLKEFKEIFKSSINFEPWSLQETWATRFFMNSSFALIAPTGIGKTTFGLVLSKYIFEKNMGKVYLIFPTNLLVNQAKEKLISFGVPEDNIIAYSSKYYKTKKQEDSIKKKIKSSDFKILITTTNFLYKNINIIPKGEYSLIFIDDVDSILKRAKNIDKIIYLFGFQKNDLDKVFQYISLKKTFLKSGFEGKEEIINKYNKLKEEIENIKKKRKGVLIVSSATSNPKSSRVQLFKELFDFEIGKKDIGLRNIVDVYEKGDNIDLYSLSLERIKEFGNGGLVFISGDKTKDELYKYIEYLNKNGIKAISYEDLDKKINAFKRGRIKVVVGFSSFKNPLTRGLDFPEVIRYALFVGVPKIKIYLKFENFKGIYYFLLSLFPIISKNKIISDEDSEKLYKNLKFLESFLYVDENKISKIKIFKIEKIIDEIKELIFKENNLKKLEELKDIEIKREDDIITIFIPDIIGYIQASGRTSRLFPGGLTKGLSYILVDDDILFESLKKKLNWIIEDIEFKKSEEINLKEILNEIDKDREKIKKIKKGEKIQEKIDFKTSLIVVESPNKARTIAYFFGKPLRRKIGDIDAYEISIENKFLIIVATKGHIFDLNKEEGIFGVIKKNGEFIPIFEPIDEDRVKIIESIRKLGIEVNEIYLATDPDTEGEKISFDLFLTLNPINPNSKRIEFHEVTKKAFINSINNMREINYDLVKSQLLRRISDRWIGFTISQYIQKRLNNLNLSAGRVQTPVLEWIVNRFFEREKKLFVVSLELEGEKIEFEFEDKNFGQWFFVNVKRIKIVKEGEEVETTYVRPLTTDTLLSISSNKLKYSPQKTMDLAQDLFEAGLITYHRTDSTRVSDAGLRVAIDYIKENFGEEYIKLRTFEKEGGAHECIRPTRSIDSEELKSFILYSNIQGITDEHIKLYDLIFREFIASQMRETKVKKVIIKYIPICDSKEMPDLGKREKRVFEILENGYNLILPIKLEGFIEGDLKFKNKNYYYKPKYPPYTYATIIQEMKEKGIGRPSTYAITIDKLLKRGYLYEKGGYLYPTQLGIEVINLIKKRKDMYSFVKESFTKELEEVMDKIENKESDYKFELNKLYENLKKENLL
ncbi:MAG: reverse gyrase [Caldisericia bacterium]|nr:reverse gyrase [Caldisericia bacterium]